MKNLKKLLLEMPVLYPYTSRGLSRYGDKRSYIRKSDFESQYKDYKLFDNATLGNYNFNFYYIEKELKVVILDVSNDVLTYRAGEIDFKDSNNALRYNLDINDVNNKKIFENSLQIRYCNTKEEYEKLGLMSYAYFSIIKNLKKSIVSDNEQFKGAVALWKKLAKLSSQNNCYVYIIKDGQIYNYNDNKLKDWDIWSIDRDVEFFPKNYHTLLFLTDKKII